MGDSSQDNTALCDFCGLLEGPLFVLFACKWPCLSPSPAMQSCTLPKPSLYLFILPCLSSEAFPQEGVSSPFPASPCSKARSRRKGAPFGKGEGTSLSFRACYTHRKRICRAEVLGFFRFGCMSTQISNLISFSTVRSAKRNCKVSISRSAAGCHSQRRNQSPQEHTSSLYSISAAQPSLKLGL